MPHAGRSTAPPPLLPQLTLSMTCLQAMHFACTGSERSGVQSGRGHQTSPAGPQLALGLAVSSIWYRVMFAMLHKVSCPLEGAVGYSIACVLQGTISWLRPGDDSGCILHR